MEMSQKAFRNINESHGGISRSYLPRKTETRDCTNKL